MTIGSISGANPQTAAFGVGTAMDSYSRNIQNQIANAQKALQDLSSNEELSMEEKMKKRQEINQEITNLNNQLRQHQMEVRKQASQGQGGSMDDMLGEQRQAQRQSDSPSAGISSAGMQAILSADQSMKQVQVQGNVKTSLEGRAGVLKAEIKQDAGRGGVSGAKETELAGLEERAADITGSQMQAIADINRELEEAAEKDSKAEKTDGSQKERVAEQEEDGNMNTDTIAGSEENMADQSDRIEALDGDAPESAGLPYHYVPIDIVL